MAGDRQGLMKMALFYPDRSIYVPPMSWLFLVRITFAHFAGAGRWN